MATKPGPRRLACRQRHAAEGAPIGRGARKDADPRRHGGDELRLRPAIHAAPPGRSRVIDRYEMRLAEQQFPLLDGEKFDGEISCRHLLEFYGMRKASH